MRRCKRPTIKPLDGEVERIGVDYFAAQHDKKRFDKALHKAGLMPDREGRVR